MRDISYDNLVSKMIAEKYSIDKELALHRQREIKTRRISRILLIIARSAKQECREALRNE